MTTTTKERPFNATAHEVIAIREGRMTMFRRPCTKVYDTEGREAPWAVCPAAESGWIAWYGEPREGIERFTRKAYSHGFPSPFGEVGERLYVREAWCYATDLFAATVGLGYRADSSVRLTALPGSTIPDGATVYNGHSENWPVNVERWRSASTMPRWASRDALELTGNRVERLQGITEEDCFSEGIDPFGPDYDEGERLVTAGSSLPAAKWAYGKLWDSRYAKPKPVRRTINLHGPPERVITHYVSYPWEDVQEVREHRGLPWYVHGNCWVWVNEFRRVEG